MRKSIGDQGLILVVRLVSCLPLHNIKANIGTLSCSICPRISLRLNLKRHASFVLAICTLLYCFSSETGKQIYFPITARNRLRKLFDVCHSVKSKEIETGSNIEGCFLEQNNVNLQKKKKRRPRKEAFALR